jgi:hypothetical protein
MNPSCSKLVNAQCDHFFTLGRQQRTYGRIALLLLQQRIHSDTFLAFQNTDAEHRTEAFYSADSTSCDEVAIIDCCSLAGGTQLLTRRWEGEFRELLVHHHTNRKVDERNGGFVHISIRGERQGLGTCGCTHHRCMHVPGQCEPGEGDLDSANSQDYETQKRTI